MNVRDDALKKKNIAGEGVAGFKKILKRRYGSMYRAWRQGPLILCWYENMLYELLARAVILLHEF